MERRTFLHVGGLACLAGAVASTGLVGCAGARYVDATLEGEDLHIPLTGFATAEGRPPLSHVVARHASLRWPIAVYRKGDGGYRALLMRCTHQGAQLKAGEVELVCPAHGSTFFSDGSVSEGPATLPLRELPVSVVGDQLFISLKA
ncbi:MAG: Rieske (2Fe-2S) protein [Flavobacteriales bacterium]